MVSALQLKPYSTTKYANRLMLINANVENLDFGSPD